MTLNVCTVFDAHNCTGGIKWGKASVCERVIRDLSAVFYLMPMEKVYWGRITVYDAGT